MPSPGQLAGSVGRAFKRQHKLVGEGQRESPKQEWILKQGSVS